MRSPMLALVAALTLLGAVAGAVLDWQAFLRSWLAVTLTWGLLPLGAMLVLLTHGLTGGRWGDTSLWLWRALLATLPLFLVAMVPPMLGLEVLFPWTAAPETLPEVVQNKLAYLNEPFFLARSLFYAGSWLLLAWWLGAWRHRSRARLQAPAMILWLLVLTFFSVDWLVSLEPRFYSDIYGLMLAAGITAAALAAGLAIAGERLRPDLRRDIANLWLAVLLAWALLAFSQYIIIWSANLPDEIGWYLNRRQGLWQSVSVASFVLFFLVPFAVLLSGRAKGRGDWLRGAALVCLAGHVLQMHWLVLPSFDHWQPLQWWLTPLLVAGVGACYGLLAHQYTRREEVEHG